MSCHNRGYTVLLFFKLIVEIKFSYVFLSVEFEYVISFFLTFTVLVQKEDKHSFLPLLTKIFVIYLFSRNFFLIFKNQRTAVFKILQKLNQKYLKKKIGIFSENCLLNLMSLSPPLKFGKFSKLDH
jgi:hypothetical protein